MRRNAVYLNDSPLKPDRFSSQPKNVSSRCCMNQAPRIPMIIRSPKMPTKISVNRFGGSNNGGGNNSNKCKKSPRDKPIVMIRRDVPCSSSSNSSSSSRWEATQPRITKRHSMPHQIPTRQSDRRRVKFARYDDIHEIPSVSEYTKKEIQSIWMTRKDFKAIRLECRTVVKALDNRTDDGEDQELPEGYYLRGLDQQTMVYKQRSDVIIRKVHEAVFRIQQFQRNNPSKVVDASILMAKVSSKYSEPAVIAAQMAAMSDLFSAFKDIMTKRSIPNIKDMPTSCDVTICTM